MSKPVNIYFCGSIRGGRQDINYYIPIVEHLKTRGHVFTEVIADPTLTKEGQCRSGWDAVLKKQLVNTVLGLVNHPYGIATTLFAYILRMSC